MCILLVSLLVSVSFECYLHLHWLVGFLTMCAALLIRNVSVKGKIRGSSGPEKPQATNEKVEVSVSIPFIV